jgi:hypothetical protein
MVQKMYSQLLPLYVRPQLNQLSSSNYSEISEKFYFAHFDTHTGNVLVNPEDGTLSGLVDWEFSGTLPAQASEHYPAFLTSRDSIVYLFERAYGDGERMLAKWRQRYNSHFSDEDSKKWLNDRIDAICGFEDGLMGPDDGQYHMWEDFERVIKELEAKECFVRPLPKAIYDGFSALIVAYRSTNIPRDKENC